uniref:Uncharacterized protein n=1 Tax=Cacopsylla melanoneura TaxID=428564 RepID=A0A8D8YM78_9HEMI
MVDRQTIQVWPFLLAYSKPQISRYVLCAISSKNGFIQNSMYTFSTYLQLHAYYRPSYIMYYVFNILCKIYFFQPTFFCDVGTHAGWIGNMQKDISHHSVTKEFKK